jgi:hypothetical protein
VSGPIDGSPTEKKAPPTKEQQAEGYEAAASDKLAEAEAARILAEANRAVDEDIEVAVHEARARALREEAAVCAQLSSSFRLALLFEDRIEVVEIEDPDHPHRTSGPEHPHQP